MHKNDAIHSPKCANKLSFLSLCFQFCLSFTQYCFPFKERDKEIQQRNKMYEQDRNYHQNLKVKLNIVLNLWNEPKIRRKENASSNALVFVMCLQQVHKCFCHIFLLLLLFCILLNCGYTSKIKRHKTINYFIILCCYVITLFIIVWLLCATQFFLAKISKQKNNNRIKKEFGLRSKRLKTI